MRNTENDWAPGLMPQDDALPHLTEDPFNMVGLAAIRSFSHFATRIGDDRHTNLSDVFIMGGSTDVDRSGYVNYGGYNVFVYIASACQGTCQYNPGNTYIQHREVAASNGGAFFQIFNNQGNLLMTVRTYNSSTTSYMRQQLTQN